MKNVESNFRCAIQASGLVSDSQWEYCVRLLRHRLAGQESSTSTAEQDKLLKAIMIEQAALTEYQANQLSLGHTKLTLGPYVITDWIGQGGMGQVFKAVHQVMGRECAVKVLPTSRATPESLAGFIREIRLQAQLDCSYLVRAYDAGQDGNVHYLVTEYVPGMDLRRLIKSRGPLSQEQAARIVMQAALGLEYAHQQGMVHRDVKPGNILVTPEGVAKVSDVGLAGFTANLMEDPRAGKIVGTADYLSPEQIKTPLEVGPVSDVYSLGCTLYYAVCGKVPFPGGDTQTKVRRHLEETPWHPRRFANELSEEFVDIVADMMEKDPKKRTQTCAEVATRLEPWALDAAQLSQTRMGRSPWMAPPPPALEVESLSSFDDQSQETSNHSNDTSHANSLSRSRSRNNNQSDLPSAPNDSGLTDVSLGSRSQRSLTGTDSTIPAPNFSRGMLIAMTVVIILPPALLIGAMIGYLVANWPQ